MRQQLILVALQPKSADLDLKHPIAHTSEKNVKIRLISFLYAQNLF